MSQRRDEFDDLAIDIIKLTLIVTILAIIGAILFCRWLCQAATWTSLRLARRFGGGRAPAERSAAWAAVAWFAFFALLGLATLDPILALVGLILGVVAGRLVFVELSSWGASESALSQPGTLVLGAIQENWWGAETPYLVDPRQRAAHMTLVGPTGAGKSSATVHLLLQDAWSGAGMTIIDPKGDLASPFLSSLPEGRIDDVVLLEPGSSSHVVGLNPLSNVDPAMWTLVASEMNAAMSALFGETFSRRQAHLLRICLLALLSIERSTLLDLHRLLVDDQFRKQVAFRSPNEMVRTTLIDLESTWSRADIQPLIWKTASIFNTYPEARAIFSQPKPKISLEEIVDSGKILIVNAPTGIVGEEVSDLLCTLVAIRVRLACHRRAAVSADDRRFHALYIDEASHIESGALTRLITESRSFKLAACVISQSLSYFTRELQLSLSTNVYTRLRVFQQDEAHWLEVARISGEEPIIFPHPGPLPPVDHERVERIRARSRELYGSPVRVLEPVILQEEEDHEEELKQTATGETAPQSVPRPKRASARRSAQPKLTILEGEPDVVDEE